MGTDLRGNITATLERLHVIFEREQTGEGGSNKFTWTIMHLEL